MENKNKEHFTTDSIFPQVSELRASDVKITDYGRLQLVMKDEVSTRYASCSVDRNRERRLDLVREHGC